MSSFHRIPSVEDNVYVCYREKINLILNVPSRKPQRNLEVLEFIYFFFLRFDVNLNGLLIVCLKSFHMYIL